MNFSDGRHWQLKVAWCLKRSVVCVFFLTEGCNNLLPPQPVHQRPAADGAVCLYQASLIVCINIFSHLKHFAATSPIAWLVFPIRFLYPLLLQLGALPY